MLVFGYEGKLKICRKYASPSRLPHPISAGTATMRNAYLNIMTMDGISDSQWFAIVYCFPPFNLLKRSWSRVAKAGRGPLAARHQEEIALVPGTLFVCVPSLRYVDNQSSRIETNRPAFGSWFVAEK